MSSSIFNFKRESSFTALLVAFALLLAAAVFNYTMDPGGHFHKHREAVVADLLLSGKYVSRRLHWDEPTMLRLLSKGREKKPDLLVVGSSRSRLFAPEDMPGRSLENYSISNASLAAIYGVLAALDESNKLPKELWWGVDPWIFDVNYRKPQTNGFRPEIMALSRGLLSEESLDLLRDQLDEFHDPGFSQLINMSYLLSSWKQFREGEQYLVSDKRDPRYWSKSPAGPYYPPRGYKMLDRLLPGAEYACPGISPEMMRVFVELLENVAGRGTKVTLILPPFHPVTYAAMLKSEKHKAVVEIEKELIRLGKAKGWEVLGSYNPKACGCEKDGFMDGSHPRRECHSKILALKR